MNETVGKERIWDRPEEVQSSTFQDGNWKLFRGRSKTGIYETKRKKNWGRFTFVMTAGEFWSYWLQYLAFFAIFRNFLFILFLIAAIKSNVVEWKPDPELDFGMFFIMPDLFLPLSRRRKRKSGGKISKMAPFDLDEFLPENAFLDFKKVYILIWTPIPL